MNKTLNFLKSLHSDLIDGIESGVNTEDEKAEVFECIEEIESFMGVKLHCSKGIKMRKKVDYPIIVVDGYCNYVIVYDNNDVKRLTKPVREATYKEAYAFALKATPHLKED